MDFDEKLYEEDEFDETPTVNGGQQGDEGGTHIDDSDNGEGGEPGGSNNEIDLTTEVLRLRGIANPNEIQFEDENGAVIKRSWDSLSKNEQLNIILGDQKPEEDQLTDDEIQLINMVRMSGGDIKNFLDSYAEQNAPEQTQPSYKIDELSDDEMDEVEEESDDGQFKSFCVMFSITLVPVADVVPVKSDVPYHEQEQGQ